ncbi:MAG TPA: hypothetical protein VMB47_08115 [Candidatus Aquilonibacter sp.]|nr:hypothetical protein [Candidatus Aquilonibacter sp.]
MSAQSRKNPAKVALSLRGKLASSWIAALRFALPYQGDERKRVTEGKARLQQKAPLR